MDSCSDHTSDSDEELPVFDFLQSSRHLRQASQGTPEKPDLVDLEDSDVENTGVFAQKNAGAQARRAEIMMISSDSDEDSPYVPLAQRLKHRQDNVVSASSSVPKGGDSERRLPSQLASVQASRQTGFSESERPRSLHQVRTASSEELQDFSRPVLKPLSDTSSAKSKLTKRTAEGISASGDEALKRRQAKERQQWDREALRKEQERQKAERKAVMETAKSLRPEECIKHMVVAVDPALLQLEGGGTLLASVQALGCSCAIEKQPIPRSVSWMRRAPRALVIKGTSPQCPILVKLDEGECVPEAQVVMQMTVEDFITLIHNYIQKERHGRLDCGPTLTSWVQDQQMRHPSKTLSVVVIELENYFRLQKSQQQKRLKQAVACEDTQRGKPRKKRKNDGAEALPEVSRVDVEEALVHLQLHTRVSVQFLSSWKEFSDRIAMTTKAVGEAPFKLERERTCFSFYLESEWAGGQRVDKAGKGLLQAWKRQIQQFNRVSPDMAEAILAAYPSPQLLKKAYSRCRSDKEKVSLLSDLLIRRGEGVTSTTRRVGPELSKRFYLLMHSCDPELVLDSSV